MIGNFNDTKNFSMTIFSGSVNKDFHVTYGYRFMFNSHDAKYPTVKETDKGTIVINQSYSLSLFESYNGGGLFIPGKDWERFCSLLEKTVKLISENLYDLYPNVDSHELDIDHRTLDRFKTEKACSTGGMSMYPDVWVNKENETFPAIQMNTSIGSCTTIKVPLEDAVPLVAALKRIDPNLYGLGIIEAFNVIK